MKKFIVFALFGLMIFAVGSEVYAQKLDFKVSGFISTSTRLSRNNPGDVPFGFNGWGGTTDSIVSPFTSPFRPPSAPGFETNSAAWNRTNSVIQSRAFLNLDAIMSKELMGRVTLEIDALSWGGFAGATAVGSAGGRTSDRNNMGFWTGDRAAVEVKNAYVSAGLPYIGIPAPMTVNVGLIPLGVRPWVFAYIDGAGITGAIKVDPVTIIPMYGKAVEGKYFTADDSDLYGLHANAKVGTFTVGGYAVNFNMNTYPLSRATTTVAPQATNSFKADFWWWGAYADGRLGPVDVQWDFVYDRGSVDTRTNFARGLPSGSDAEVEYRGWISRAKINYPWEKFNFGMAGAYATGADLNKTSNSGLPGTEVSGFGVGSGKRTTKVGSYVVPPGAENPGANDDMIVFGNLLGAEASPFNFSPGPGVYPNQVHRGSYGGTWFAKAFVGYKIAPWYKINLEGLYIGDTTKNGNTFGDAARAVRAVVPEPETAARPTSIRRDDKTVGWELNLINEINIYKNLKFDVGGGVLFAGDALDQHDSSTNSNKSPKNPWAIMTKLRYSF